MRGPHRSRCARLAEAREHEAWDPMRVPYPGLASFTSSDAAVFFGREAGTAMLERRLQRRLLDEEPLRDRRRRLRLRQVLATARWRSSGTSAPKRGGRRRQASPR